jgi:predicted SAM-dependent methyltransferase
MITMSIAENEIARRSRGVLPSGPKVNLGCGPVQPEGWVNVDGSNRAWLACRLSLLDRLLVRLRVLPPTEFGPHITLHNLFEPLPFPTNSVAGIYAGEVWEHFEYPDAVRLTAECRRVLAPGGVLRVCVPDGITFWERYLELYQKQVSLPRGARSAQPLREHIAMFFREICTRKKLLGSMGHTHKWQFDEIQLIEVFESCGFTEVERMPFRQSRIPDVELVERSDFLIVEGVKAS